MELFRATVMPDKKLYRKAGDALFHKTKSVRAFLISGLIICLVVGPLLTYISYINHFEDVFIVPTLGIIFIIYYFFAPSYMGKALFKSQSKKNLAKETTYSFTENEIRVSTVDSSSVYNYSAIEELYETDELICLYFNKQSAFIIPKDRIENPLCDVRMFLESRVGKKVNYVKKVSTGKSIAKTFAVLAASIVLTILSAGVADLVLEEPQTFSYKNYSITLDNHFYEDGDFANHSYTLFASDATMTVDDYSQKDIDYALDKENSSLEELAKSYCEGNRVKNVKKINHYTYDITFYDNVDGIDYYNIVSVQQIEDIYWVTQIYCEKILENDYKDKFEDWISSINFKGNEA